MEPYHGTASDGSRYRPDPNSYPHENRGNYVDGHARAHFGDVYNFSNAAHDQTEQVSQEHTTSSRSPTAWLTQAVSSAWQSWSVPNELEGRLADWAEEAQGPDGSWRIPVLTVGALERHLSLRKNQHDKWFQTSPAGTIETEPRGPCQSTFKWAQLLHSLDINPGEGLIVWRHTAPEESPLQHKTIWLEIEGEALVHILNNLLESPGRKTADRQLNDLQELQLPCGSLRGSCHQDSFDFVYSQQRYQHQPLNFRFKVDEYKEIIHSGISKPEAVLPSHDAPLGERVSSLLRCLHSFYRSGSVTVTREWLEEASRIKRRVTTSGGHSILFQECLAESLAVTLRSFSMETVVRILKDSRWSRFQKIDTSQTLYHTVYQCISPWFMYADNQFDADVNFDIYSVRSPRESIYRNTRMKPAHLVRTIKEIAHSYQDTWLSKLAPIAEEVAEILLIDHHIWEADLLPFDKSSPLWQKQIRVLG